MNQINSSRAFRTLGRVVAVAGIALGAFSLTACDKETSSSKTTTTKTTSTPEGTKKTTETTERKVETEDKNPR